MSLLLFLEVVYLRSSVLAGRCLPAVLTSTCGALGMFTSGGAEIVMPDGIVCIPPVVSPTLGGSKFEYTSGGSCGRACRFASIPSTAWRYFCRLSSIGRYGKRQPHFLTGRTAPENSRILPLCRRALQGFVFPHLYQIP